MKKKLKHMKKYEGNMKRYEEICGEYE